MAQGHRRVTAITYFRFDRDYLHDYKRNLRRLCDDFLIVEDTEGGLMHSEGEYRQRLYRKALDQGSKWAVVLDPDERIELRGIRKLSHLMAKAEQDGIPTVFRFDYRELYTPTQYRSDGIWGHKERMAVFPLLGGNVYSDADLHMPKQPLNADYRIVDTGINIYHLKHINPALRAQRRDLYEHLDPNHKYQSIGYDYLTDETGLALYKIPLSRMYWPLYHEYHMDDAIFETEQI